MRIREKYIGIIGIVFLIMLSVLFMAIYGLGEMDRLQLTADRGTSLLSQSSQSVELLKDLSISAFAPDAYSTLKDVLYFEGFTSALRRWEESERDFRRTYDEFMNDITVRRLMKSNSDTNNEYETAELMSRQAFARIDSVASGFTKLRNSGFVSGDRSYQLLLSSGDSQLFGLLSEVRSTSFYLRNSFVSFLSYFVRSINRHVDELRSSLAIFFVSFTAIGIAVCTTVAYVFGSRIAKRVRMIEAAMKRISRGDFSVRSDIRTRDELGELAASINSLSEDLRSNVDRLLHVTRDLGGAISADLNLDGVRRVIMETVLRETPANSAMLLERGATGLSVVARTAGFPDWDSFCAERAADADGANPGDPAENAGEQRAVAVVAAVLAGTPPGKPVFALRPASDLCAAVIVCPLHAEGRDYGYIAAFAPREGEGFTDLDFIIMQTYADFAALSIDNYLKYADLVASREAEYQSLQAKIQPHFLYNVLNGLVGLNRMGDRGQLENAIFALKDLLRYTLERERTVPLAEELAFVRKYLDLQKMRFGDRLAFSISCDSAAEQLRIPKLLLQPLVENAIVHGIEPLEGQGNLILMAREERFDHASATPGSAVRILIADNGVGFSTGGRESSTHIGIENVTRRLKLSYPDAALAIQSRPNSGCTVELLIKRGAA